ncbi:MAG: hypothetical protein KME26_31630 [Oscillatoria princeps RMCB-10]|jgi:hypothetical protein|nr:hypothetical protein [Oscillatoria princeps RMCB-10]
MHTLSQTEFRLEAEPALRQVFVNDDAFDEPFSPNVVARRIVYPCFQYIEPPLINAIVDAASTVGDAGCYIYDIWAVERQHYYISLSEFPETYPGIPSAKANRRNNLGMSLELENTLYLPTGKWGIMISHERHGMLGGTVEFMQCIQQAIPDIDRQVYNFIEERLRRPETGKFGPAVLRLLPGMLFHVYGQTAAEKILQEIGVSRRYWKKG